MKALFVSCALVASFGTPFGFAAAPSDAALNQLTPSEKAAGWKLLFDGASTAGWRNYKKDTFPTKGWVAAEGCLKHVGNEGGGDIISRDEFQNFDLQFEWKVAPGANSGLKYFVTEDREAAIGHEYQLIDDERHPDALRGPKWQTASFYDVLPPTNRTVRPAGQFNQSRILVQANHVEHWLNGGKVLEYELGSPLVREAIAQSKFKNVKNFGSNVRSHILLQDHGGEICFRNLKIRELPAPPPK